MKLTKNQIKCIEKNKAVFISRSEAFNRVVGKINSQIYSETAFEITNNIDVKSFFQDVYNGNIDYIYDI